MTHAVRIVAAVTVLMALVVCVPMQAQTPEIDALIDRAEQGDAVAQWRLGIFHYLGNGVPQDDAEAVRWVRLAEEQGHTTAQTNLGFMYATGRNVPQDYVQAHMWYNLAASRATGELREAAVQSRDQMADQLTPAALNDAQRLAREWEAAHPR